MNFSDKAHQLSAKPKWWRWLENVSNIFLDDDSSDDVVLMNSHSRLRKTKSPKQIQVFVSLFSPQDGITVARRQQNW